MEYTGGSGHAPESAFQRLMAQPDAVQSGETLTQRLKRSEHQALSTLKETAAVMGFTVQQWADALARYYALD